jgi:hypothetical protein
MHYMRSPLVLSRRVGQEWLLALPNRDEIDIVSGTAGTVWELLETPATVADLSKALSEIYESSSEAIAAEVSDFVGVLSERRLLERWMGDS